MKYEFIPFCVVTLNHCFKIGYYTFQFQVQNGADNKTFVDSFFQMCFLENIRDRNTNYNKWLALALQSCIVKTSTTNCDLKVFRNLVRITMR